MAPRGAHRLGKAGHVCHHVAARVQREPEVAEARALQPLRQRHQRRDRLLVLPGSGVQVGTPLRAALGASCRRARCLLG